MATFKKVCVIGAGIMGQGIAAHVANARIPVLLLDIVPPKAEPGEDTSSKAFRNKFARTGLEKAIAAKPALFFTKTDAALVETGNTEDDLKRVAECDLVIEVIIEKMEAKQALFAKLEPLLKAGTIVTSNTSGLQIEGMTQGRGADFKKNFAVTHFFNPVRYMALLEIVRGKETSPDVVTRLHTFGERTLGKGVVFGKDTPNFVANRIGVFGIMETIRVMLEDKYTLEEVDAVFGPSIGRAKSAVFGTADVVGLDTFVHVAQNCWDNLPNDERHDVFKIPAFLQKMVDNKWLGRKTKGGFYKKVGDDILTLDVDKMEYRAKQKVRYESLGAVRNLESTPEKLKTIMEHSDRGAALFWKVTAATLCYAGRRLGEIADDVPSVDNAMKWGFMHEMGPFESWDAIGVRSSVERMRKENFPVPQFVNDMLAQGRESFYSVDDKGVRSAWDPRVNKPVVINEGPRVMSFTLLKSDKTRIVNDAFGTTLVDLGDGALACEFHTKMNAVDDEIIGGLNRAIDLCEEGKFEALVIANDAQRFSVGANILLMLLAAREQQWDEINKVVKAFQDVNVRLKYSAIPVVAAPFDMALGGGAEIVLWSNRVRAHAELYIGLVEAGIGLLPGGGGTVEMLGRALEGAPDDPTFPTEQLIRRALEGVALAKVATSAEEAREQMFLQASDGVTLNRRHLLAAAKWEALGMARAGFTPPRRRIFRLPGRGAYATFDMALSPMRDGHYISDHDLKVAKKIAWVMTGGDTSSRVKLSEQHMLDLEREAFLSLIGEEKTQERMGYMLENNKPLRN